LVLAKQQSKERLGIRERIAQCCDKIPAAIAVALATLIGSAYAGGAQPLSPQAGGQPPVVVSAVELFSDEDEPLEPIGEGLGVGVADIPGDDMLDDSSTMKNQAPKPR
jgi:hypothetical protein